MLVILCTAITRGLSGLARLVRRERPLELRETPVISQLPRSIGIPTSWRRNRWR